MRNKTHGFRLIGWSATLCLMVWVYALIVNGFISWTSTSNPAWKGGIELHTKLMEIGFTGVLILSFLAGLVRACCYHPLLNPSYKQWLMSTPWTSGKPLPLGPIHLVWRDAVSLALLSATTWIYLEHGPLPILVLFCLGYVAASVGLLIAVKEGVLVYLQLVLFGALIRFGHSYWAFGAITALLMFCATFGLLRSLKRFPWGAENEPLTEPPLELFVDRTGFLTPTTPKPWTPIPRHELVLLAALLGWYAYALVSCPALRQGFPPLANTLLFFIGTTAFFRYTIYWPKLSPPLPLLGQLLQFRPIIPGYHSIWLSPLACVGTGLGGIALVRYSPMDPAICCGLTVFAVMLSAFCVGPRIYDWQLSGHGHVVFINRTQRRT